MEEKENIKELEEEMAANLVKSKFMIAVEKPQEGKTEEEQKKYFVKFNVDGLLRGDFKSRMSGYAIGRQNGWYSANDIRELEDMNKIPKELGGDRYLCNGNMVDINNAGNYNSGGESENE